MAKKSKKKKNKKKGENGGGEEKPVIRGSVKKNITAIVLIMLAIIFFLSLFGMAGIIGEKFNKLLNVLFGYGKYVFPVVMIVLGGFYFKKNEINSIHFGNNWSDCFSLYVFGVDSYF